jgi:hypothetical protein
LNRNTVRLIGLLLLLPSVYFGLLPYLAAHNMLVSGLGTFHIGSGNLTIVDFHKDLNGTPVAETWWGVWIFAVIAEMLLLGVNVFRPIQRNRFKITIRG